MAVATTQEPEKSLFEKVGRVGNLLNQGVESMVAGTLSLPALVVDGYINLGRFALNGTNFKTSNLADASKQTIINMGRAADGTAGKVVAPQNSTEQKIVLAAEIATGLVGPSALKSVKTFAEGTAALNGAKTATIAAKAQPAATVAAAETSAATKTASAGNSIEWVAPTLTPEVQAAAAAKIAANRASAAGSATTTVTPAAATVASTAAKTEYGTSQILKTLRREKELPARLEALSGHGAKADAMVERLIAGARKTGVSGDDWRAIQNSRSLSPDVMKKVDDIYNATRNSAWGIGPAWERAKGTAAYWKTYPVESTLRAVPDVVRGTGSLLSTGWNHKGKLAVLGTAGYLGYGVFTSDAQARDVSLLETVAQVGSQALTDVSRLSGSALLTTATIAAAKMPGVGDAALDVLRGTSRTLVREMADGEDNEAAAWEKAKDKLGKFLPAASVTALGEFVKGKDIKSMTEEQRARITDAMEAISSPRGDKAKALLALTVDEAKKKAEEARRLASTGAPSVIDGVRQAASDVADAADDLVDMDEIKGYIEKFGNTLHKNPSAAMGGLIGAVVGYKIGTNKKQRALTIPAYAAVVGVFFEFLSRMYPGMDAVLLKIGGSILDKMGDTFGDGVKGLKGAFDRARNGVHADPAPVPAPAPATSGPRNEPPPSAGALSVSLPSGERTIMSMFANAGSGVAHTDKPTLVPAKPDYSLASTKRDLATLDI